MIEIENKKQNVRNGGSVYQSRLNFNIKLHMQSSSLHRGQRNKVVSMTRSNKKVRERSYQRRYIVVDSENEEQYGNRIKWDIDRSTRPNSIQLQDHKQRGKSNTNIESHQSDCLRNIDEDITAAEEEVKRLQQECIVLQRAMNKMIKESAELKVEEHKRKRSQSLQRDDESLGKRCPVHKQFNSGVAPQKNQEIIKFKLSGISSSSQAWTNTLLLSQNKEEILIEDLQPKIKNNKSKAFNQQNIAPPKDRHKPYSSLLTSSIKPKKQVR